MAKKSIVERRYQKVPEPGFGEVRGESCRSSPEAQVSQQWYLQKFQHNLLAYGSASHFLCYSDWLHHHFFHFFDSSTRVHKTALYHVLRKKELCLETTRKCHSNTQTSMCIYYHSVHFQNKRHGDSCLYSQHLGGRHRQISKFETMLTYRASSGTARATQRTPAPPNK